MPEPVGSSGISTTVPRQYRRLVNQASAASGVPVPVEAAQIDEESGWDPNAVSPKGAEGIAQFEPGTWKQWGHGSPFNPQDAFPAYGAYMGSLLQQEGGSYRDALAAYNAGPGDLQAGYGYADTILAAAGMSQQSKTVPYANPLRDVQGLTAERIDMGEDFSGEGPVYAVGPGIITATQNSGWPGGNFIGERITEGPLKDHDIYVAEDVQPEVSVGQHVDARTRLGTMYRGPSGIEIGFAAPPGTGDPLGASQWDNVHSTAYGQAISQVLTDLGAPPGHLNPPVKGELPSWLRNVGKGLHGTAPPSGGGGGGIFGGIASAIGDLTAPFTDIGSALHGIEEAVSWFSPSKILRTICFFAGSAFVVLGVVALARPRVTLPVLGSTPVVPAGELGPAFGIAAVTGGSVLLFFAFHNTDVTSFQGFLGAIQGRLHGQPIAAS